MPTIRIRVHPDFEKMLKNTLKYIETISEKKMSMEELTKILASNTNGSSFMSLKFPVILIPERIAKGRPRKSIWNKYINIVLEDQPR